MRVNIIHGDEDEIVDNNTEGKTCGDADKDGFVSKELLIEIIKMEFEMTLDMEEYLRKSGGDGLDTIENVQRMNGGDRQSAEECRVPLKAARYFIL